MSITLNSSAIKKLKVAIEGEEKVKAKMMEELQSYKKKVHQYKGDLIDKEDQLIDADGDNNYKNIVFKDDKVREQEKINLVETRKKEEQGKKYFYTNAALANGLLLISAPQHYSSERDQTRQNLQVGQETEEMALYLRALPR